MNLFLVKDFELRLNSKISFQCCSCAVSRAIQIGVLCREYDIKFSKALVVLYDSCIAFADLLSRRSALCI